MEQYEEGFRPLPRGIGFLTYGTEEYESDRGMFPPPLEVTGVSNWLKYSSRVSDL